MPHGKHKPPVTAHFYHPQEPANACLLSHVETWESEQHSYIQLLKHNRKTQDLKMSLHTKNRQSNPMSPNEKAITLYSLGRRGQAVREGVFSGLQAHAEPSAGLDLVSSWPEPKPSQAHNPLSHQGILLHGLSYFHNVAAISSHKHPQLWSVGPTHDLSTQPPHASAAASGVCSDISKCFLRINVSRKLSILGIVGSCSLLTYFYLFWLPSSPHHE